MLRMIALGAALVAATPALAAGYVGQYTGYYRPHWHPYPNCSALIPYGWPMITSVRSYAYIAQANYALLPVRVFFVPQQQPLYNVPPYALIAPY